MCAAKVRYIEAESRSPSLKSASPGAPGAFRLSATSCSGSGYGRGLMRTLFTTLNTAVLAPIPMASVRITVIANPGEFLRRRSESFPSASSDSIAGHCHTSRPRCSTRVGFPKARSAASRASGSGKIFKTHQLLGLLFDVSVQLLRTNRHRDADDGRFVPTSSSRGLLKNSRYSAWDRAPSGCLRASGRSSRPHAPGGVSQSW